MTCENRQQLTWILRSPSCTVVRTCVCAPFFSSFFVYSSTHHLLTNSNYVSEQSLHMFFELVFVLSMCENRQQPTWIFRSLSCTVVRTCVCAPFFFSFFTLLYNLFFINIIVALKIIDIKRLILSSTCVLNIDYFVFVRE